MLKTAFFATLSALLLTHGAQAQEKHAQTFRLTNGMEVIVVENHRVPAVSHMLWFFIGAADDPPAKSGLAHYHEHIMFKGSEHYKSGEYADIIARHGGEQNAFTAHDATSYYANIAKEHLPLIMQLEADRIRGLTPDPQEALKERDVIIEERRMRIDNSPRAQFAEQLNAALYLNHPYHIPVIGWKHEMEGLTRDDVLEFHRTYYHAGNALLIVSGDVTAAEVKKLAEHYYGALPAGPKVTREWKKEPPHLAALRLAMTHANVEQPEWRRMYIAPGAGEGTAKNELMALFVLEQILGGSETSRLYRALVREQKLAASVSASYSGLSRGPAEFTISAILAPGADMSALEKAVDREIARLAREPVSAEELARAKTLQKADTIYTREGLESMAHTLGWFRMVGLTLEDYEQWTARTETVTAEDVQRAAAKLFDLKQSVTGVLLPEEKAP